MKMCTLIKINVHAYLVISSLIKEGFVHFLIWVLWSRQRGRSKAPGLISSMGIAKVEHFRGGWGGEFMLEALCLFMLKAW